MRHPDPDQPPPAPHGSAAVEPEALLLSAVQSVPDAVVTADEDGRITTWTGGAEAIFGWPAAEILGLEGSVLLPERHRAAFARTVEQDRAGGDHPAHPRGPVEVTALRRDGTEIPVELTLTPGTHAGRRFYAAIVRDVTARHLAERQHREVMAELARSNSELQQFAAVASHDLREPLRIVDGYLGLLRRRAGDALDPQSLEFIDHAVDAVARMQRLIDDLLRYARAGSGGTHREPVALGAIAREAQGTLAAAVEASGARITIEELPEVHGDPALLRQVFQNLLANAMKFTPPDETPEVTVRAHRLDGAWEISVADRGIGVDPEASARIFEMFGRARGAGRDRAGSGIGLAICKRAIEAHGGTIRVVPAPGGGSDFRFSIPDADAGAP